MEEEENIQLSDADTLSCVLGYYLRNTQKLRSNSQEGDKRKDNNNIYYITADKNTAIDSETSRRKLPSLSNILTKPDNNQNICDLDIFKNLEKNQLFFNQVTPLIELYKIAEINTAAPSNDFGKKFVELKIPFDTVAGQKHIFSPPESDNDYIEKLLKGGSGNAVGISDFSWKTEGKNEGNNTVYTVNFKIILQNISELETIRNIDSQTGVQVTLLDLLYPPRKGGKFMDDPNSFQPEKVFIKAKVGWNLPEGYKDFENYFKTNLYLYLYKHNFSFHESGKVELTLTYIGNIESMFNDKTKYDIFGSNIMSLVSQLRSYLTELVTSTAPNIETVKKANQITRKIWPYLTPSNQGAVDAGTVLLGFKDAFVPGGPKGFYNITLTDKDEIKKYITYLEENIISKNKVNFFNKILKNLIDKKMLYTIKLEKEEFDKFKSIMTSTNIDATVLGNLRRTTSELNRAAVGNISSEIPEDQQQVEDGVTQEDEGYFYDTGKYLISYEKLYKELNNPDWVGGPKYVNYIYLDDLIQEVINIADLYDKNINIFFAPYTYKDYQSLSNFETNNSTKPLEKVYENNQPKYYKILDVKRRMGNLGHIPISLNVLINWYNEEINKSNETSYSFFTFLKKCYTTLIPESIGAKNAPNAPEQNVIISNNMFNTTSEEVVNLKKYKFEKNGAINFIDYKSANAHYNSSVQPFRESNVYKNIFYISEAEDDMSLYKGKKEEDCKLHVLHLNLNDAMNFIKKTNFKRDDNQKLETANLLAANTKSGNKIIRQVYHCDLDLFGNNFFAPGNLIYIKPNYPGANLPMNILFEIGLGGYYRVIEVNNQIGVGSYTTSINCRWEMFGGGITPDNIVTPPAGTEIYYRQE